MADNACMFVSSSVLAEMKKTASYKGDVKVDPKGVVMQAQCECAVGQRPDAHCKHVTCTIFALVKFKKEKAVLTELTCTQVSHSYIH